MLDRVQSTITFVSEERVVGFLMVLEAARAFRYDRGALTLPDQTDLPRMRLTRIGGILGIADAFDC